MEINKDILYHNRVQYLKIYEYLIKKAILYEVFDGYGKNEYLEIHHIFPKCQGGDNSEFNLVKVDARTHIILHMLLSKMYPDDAKLAAAARACTIYNGTVSKRENAISRISTRLLAEARENARKLSTGDKHPRATKVVCYDEDFNVIRIYNCIKDVEKDGFIRSCVSACCSKTGRVTKTHNNYYWMKYNEFIIDHPDKIKEYENNSSKGIFPELNTNYINSSKENKLRNKIVTKDTREKLSKISLGKKLSDSSKKKLSESIKEHWKTKVHPSSTRIMDPDGKIYNSIGECAKDKGVYKSTIKRRLERKNSGYSYVDGGINPNSRGIKILDINSGKIFNTIGECASYFNVGYDTVYRWINRNDSHLKRLN